LHRVCCSPPMKRRSNSQVWTGGPASKDAGYSIASVSFGFEDRQ
jgi:hypothetical protein